MIAMLRRFAVRLLSSRIPPHKLNLHTHVSRVLSSYNKDLPNPSLPTPISKVYSHDTDILYEQLQKAKSIERILELISLHLDVMNSKHIVTCLNSVHGLSKDNERFGSHLTENRTFQALCTRLMQTVRFLDPQEVITVYKVLTGLGVQNNSYVMQSVLKMIGAHMNDMSLSQLTFLHFLLSKQRANSLVDGLKMALPLVLQVQIDQQIDSDNTTEVVNCLRLACQSRLKPVTIEKILEAILNKVTALTPENALSTVFSLLTLDAPVDRYRELLSVSFDIVSKNVDQFDKKHVLSAIRQCRFSGFYHSPFLFAAARKAVSEKWDLVHTYELVNYFSRLKFCPTDLIDHFIEAICCKSSAIRNDVSYSPLNCLEYLTLTGYQPPRLKDAVEVLACCDEKCQKLLESAPNLMLKVVSCFTSLGSFPEKYLSTVLTEDFLFEAWSNSKKYGRTRECERNILSLMWSIEVHDQQQKFQVPPMLARKMVQNIQHKKADCDLPLAKFIESGLGGPQFVKNGVMTCDGHMIDHFVAMRSGNYPVSLSSSEANSTSALHTMEFVEDLQLPHDAKIVAIMVATADRYCKDPEVLRGWIDLEMKHLAKKSYATVVINYENWKSLPDREKVPYLMREIKNAVQTEDDLRTSSLY